MPKPFLHVAVFGLFLLLPASAPAQGKADGRDIATVRDMLKVGYDDIRKGYYDPKFHGIDLDARYRFYDGKAKSAKSVVEAYGYIAAFLKEFDDSHLFFDPPMSSTSYDDGYRMQVIGDKCFVAQVRPGSDAASKLHPGDEVLQFNGFDISRDDMHDAMYYFHVFAPRADETLALRAPNGSTRTETVHAVSREDRVQYNLHDSTGLDRMRLRQMGDAEDLLYRERFYETPELLVWKMSRFGFDEIALDTAISKARKHPALIIDLRGNPGGYEDSLLALIGRLFDHDIKLALRETRKDREMIVAHHASAPFSGKLIVLIDARSASSSELFARLVQLEHRGTVIGDRSAGAVMEALHMSDSLGAESKIFFGYSVTHANLVMADGQSLEKTGVMPDEQLRPTPRALEFSADPVLSRAAADLGAKLDPVSAGKLFPFEWPKI